MAGSRLGQSDVPRDRLMDARDTLRLPPLFRRGPRTLAEYQQWHGLRAGVVFVETFTDADPIAAYVNHGRWVVNCRHCNGGALLGWGLALCGSCGAAYTSVTMPAVRSAIEAALLVRPIEKRNWLTRETVADLLDENRAHGLL